MLTVGALPAPITCHRHTPCRSPRYHPPSHPSHECIESPRGTNLPSEMAYRGQLHASEAKPEAQLGARRIQSDEPRRVGRGKPLTGGGYITLDTHDAPFFAIAEVFFRRSRLFFREAAFSSGGEGCEWRALRATVGESGDKAENEFSGFIPLAVPR